MAISSYAIRDKEKARLRDRTEARDAMHELTVAVHCASFPRETVRDTERVNDFETLTLGI
jgi:hypothetical protein